MTHKKSIENRDVISGDGYNLDKMRGRRWGLVGFAYGI